MKFNKLLIPLFLLFFFLSCQYKVEPVNPTSWRIRSVKTNFEIITYDYVNGQLKQTKTERFYTDSLGHVPKNVCSNWSIENEQLLEKVCSNDLKVGFFAQIGANGKISEQDWAYTYRTNEYDNNGFLTKMSHFSHDPSRRLFQSMKYEISNNNVIKEWIINADGKEYLINEFEYYEDKMNTIGNENGGLTWRERSSQNLLKKIKNHYNNEIIETVYTYDFDDKNRVVRTYFSINNGNSIKGNEYTYW